MKKQRSKMQKEKNDVKKGSRKDSVNGTVDVK
jgi:hypothetical protein